MPVLRACPERGSPEGVCNASRVILPSSWTVVLASLWMADDILIRWLFGHTFQFCSEDAVTLFSKDRLRMVHIFKLYLAFDN